MKKLSSSEIRQMWLDFFASKGHHIEQGASLIPKNDPTLLWINAGVAALKKYFDGSEVPPSRRITNAQKCIRTNDIEHVGHTARHHTFFEMMGNFSIGDYFRKEVIPWAVELLLSEKWYALDKDKLYITYFPSDLETKKCWMDAGISEDHLIPQSGNFWEIGAGPCGPDTEMFYDRGEKYDPQHIGIDLLKNDMENDRYVEIWNIVFSQFNSEPGKKREEYKELPSKNIDTGAGLERLACIIQETDTNFETDLFFPIIQEVERLTGHKYDENHLAFRVIADHVRSITFALADGEMFSNEGRGYVLRRLLRRAERYGRVLGINEPFLYKFVALVSEIMHSYYPYLDNKKDFVAKMIKAEEEKFIKTLANGESLLLKAIDGKDTLDAEDMFRLYDTFGFPKELTMEICEEHHVKVDMDGFNALMEEQKQRARAARGDRQSMNKQSFDLMNCTLASEFIYDKEPIECKVIALFKDGEKVDSITTRGEIMLDRTNFYAESGGQVADTGEIENEETSLKVTNVIKAPNKQHLHSVEVRYGEVKVGDKFIAKIDEERRLRIMRNHSSVHLLQKALSEVLGDHIAQHGSFVNDEYSHFDFNHFTKMTPEQINAVERKVNAWISEAIPCETKVLPIEEAQKMGAKALFNDKYGDTVRVVCFDEVSKEFCGGTHVSNSQDIGVFVIEYEESVAAGIRRIQARTSSGAYELIKHRENLLNNVKDKLNTLSFEDINNRLTALLNEKEALKKANEALNDKLSFINSQMMKNSFIERDDLSLLVSYQKGQSRNELLSIIDNLKQGKDNYIIALLGDENGSVPIVVACSKKANEKGYKAGALVKAMAQVLLGGGGGRDELASGSGRDTSKVEAAIQLVKEMVK
ncbi:MAG: alanine--tRNA ligase [Bacilli bacterium]|nr:alanine--tRNA ligase [Bacilli bacterium]